MDGAHPFKHGGERLGVEGFVGQLPQVAAVYGVGIIGAEGGHVKFFHAGAGFFIRREGDFNRPVLHFRVVVEELDQRHNDGYAGFIVRPQKRIARGGDDVVPAGARQLGGVGRR